MRMPLDIPMKLASRKPISGFFLSWNSHFIKVKANRNVAGFHTSHC